MKDYPLSRMYVDIKPICKDCGINQIDIPTNLIDIVGNNICAKCDKVPCVLVHITEVAYVYFLTPYQWFLQRILGLKSLSSVISMSGSLYHALDDFINKEFPERFNKLKKIENKVMLFYKILNLLLKQLEVEVLRVLKNTYDRFGFMPFDVIPFLIERTYPILSKLAGRETDRIYNAVLYKLKFNPYKKIGKFNRERIVFFYEEINIKEENEGEYKYRILNGGHIDEVKDFNTFSIAFDDKSANMPEKEYDSYAIQFGGYSKGHKFVYGKPLNACLMRYPMFNWVEPIEPNENKYIELLNEMCKIDYYYTKAKIKKVLVDKMQCNWALCKEKFCGMYFPCKSNIVSTNEIVKNIVTYANEEVRKWQLGSTVTYDEFCKKIKEKYNIEEEKKKDYEIGSEGEEEEIEEEEEGD